VDPDIQNKLKYTDGELEAIEEIPSTSSAATPPPSASTGPGSSTPPPAARSGSIRARA
jgi:hypothetical protein